MTPRSLFDTLQETKSKEEFIKVLREYRSSHGYENEYVCDKCNKKRRCN